MIVCLSCSMLFQHLCIKRPAALVTGRLKGGFVKGWFWRMCPRSGFRSGGTSAKTSLLENHPFVNPRSKEGNLPPLPPPPKKTSQKLKEGLELSELFFSRSKPGQNRGETHRRSISCRTAGVTTKELIWNCRSCFLRNQAVSKP